MNWLATGVIAGLFFAIYNVLLKLSSAHLHALTGSIFLSLASMLASLGLVLILKTTGQEVDVSSKGIKLAIWAGVFSAFGSLFYFLMYQKKAPISLGLPLLSLSTLLFSVAIGLFFLGEKLTLLKVAGLLLAAISIYIIGN